MSKSEPSSHDLASGVNSSRSGTFPPMEQLKTGVQVIVGNHRVEVVKYLAEGGFAQIYVVRFIEYANELERQPSVPLTVGHLACLKRVLVTDENGLNEMRNEVGVMKQLSGSANIVQYYDSHASRSRDGTTGFEVMLLMELCPNNSLLDYMNQRLATKLSETDILKIMFDVTRALADMHHLPVPLIHRDIKIENVLVDADNNFKLCDFGSTSTCLPVANTHQEIAIITNNIYVHTTPQYRSPEMIDLYRCLPIDEKSDIWALGIFLYKLLFYTTPFELTGQFAILHSKYEIPVNNYSSKLINLIIIMLAENPNLRPNIYQVMDILCSMSRCDNPVEDKFQLGSYNFEKYAEYQAKLQKIQYQMYLSYENKQHVDVLNDLFINCFEIAPKQPVNMGQNTRSGSLEVDGSEASAIPVALSENTSAGEEDIGLVQQQFPSVEDLEGYLHEETRRDGDRHNSNTTASVGTSSHSSSKVDLGKTAETLSSSQGQPTLPSGAPPNMVRDMTARSLTSTKQHKSSNPFPYIHQEKYEVEPETNPIFESAGEVPDVNQPSIELDNAANPVQAAQSQRQASMSLLPNPQGASHSFQNQRQDFEKKESYEQYFRETRTPLVEKSVEPSSSEYPFQSMNGKQEQSLQIQQTQQTRALQQQYPDAAPNPPPQSQNLAYDPSSLQENAELLVDFSNVGRKEPQRLDLTFDSVDLSTPTKSGMKDSPSLSEQSLASSESYSVEMHRKVADSEKPSRRPPQGGTANTSLVTTQPSQGRRSLDLKYQEMDFSASPPPDAKLQKTKTTIHPSRKTNAGSDLRRSFTRGRKSLDLEHLKRDVASSTENTASKRRSFFGKFKS
ncbi:LADA_0B06722g1_1 [Lachancea dasiensis]|uniref:LADA_0B06722g1_1 n=1 Tax=Lachancea dasiensis TaxID=1072105 RepID=A0A1G4ITV6_9SACH|nr:LADA_0B06722g1_1 [Lachancea dasiensis]